MSRETVSKGRTFPAVIRLVRLLSFAWARLELVSRPDDRPLQLEVSCERDLQLAEGPYPELGASIVQIDADGGSR